MWILTYKTNSTTLDFIKLIVQIWISFGSVFLQEMVIVGDRIEASVHSVHLTTLHHFCRTRVVFWYIFGGFDLQNVRRPAIYLEKNALSIGGRLDGCLGQSKGREG